MVMLMTMRTAARSARTTVAVMVATAALGAATAILGSAPAQAAADQAAPLGEATASAAVDASTGRLPAGWRHEMLSRINAARSEAGLAPLKACASLRRAAQGYAGVMARTSTVSHVGPDGTWPWDRMRAEGFRFRAAAENLATGQTSIEQVLGDWSISPPHQANLMDPRMTQVGFGFASDPQGSGRGYWVQDFGRGAGC